MSDTHKTQNELHDEITRLKSRIAQLEQKKSGIGDENADWTRKYHFFESFITELTEPLIVIDTNYKVRYANKAAYQISAKSFFNKEESISCHELLFNSSTKCAQSGHNCLLQEVIKTGRYASVDYTIPMANGSEIVYEILASPIIGPKGKLIGIVSTIRDVTEHRNEQKLLEKGHDFLELRDQERMSELAYLNQVLRQEIKHREETKQELRWAKEQAELFYQLSPCAIFTVDSNRNVTSWNKRTEEITGYSHDDIKGKKCFIFCSQPCMLFSDKIKKPILRHECTLRTKDGRNLYISKNSAFLRDPEGKIIGGIESFEDITQRKEMETMLRAERDKIKGMIAATKQGLHIVNAKYEIEFQNDILIHIFGDQLGAKCYKIYKHRDTPCPNCLMQNVIKNNQIEHADDMIFHGKHYSQSYAPFKDTDGQTKCLVLLLDITEEVANRAKTVRTAQLASIGELAAGVAHEINNPINGIINYAQILLDDTTDKEPITPILNSVIKEGERIADIVKKLLAFARQGDDDHQELKEKRVADVIEDSLALVRHQMIKDGITITFDTQMNVPSVLINPHQLDQVFINLLNNARHALNEKFKGKNKHKRIDLKISTFEAGKTYVRTSFTDYGIGVSPSVLEFVFNPFYSTKKPGEGTGIGLSISQDLLKKFNGFIHMGSKLGQYTEVTVDLPAHRGGQHDRQH